MGDSFSLSELMVYYQNVRGLRTKLKEFAENISLTNYHIILLTETWLKTDIHSSELGLQNYLVFRNDRNLEATGKTRGGGVLIAVYSDFKATKLDFPYHSTEHEEIWVKLVIDSIDYVFCVTYFPPQYNVTEYEMHADNIEYFSNKYDNSHIYIVGDYNLPKLNFFEDEAYNYSQTQCCPANECICNVTSYCNLIQANKVPNANNVFLDLIFTNNYNTTVNIAPDTLVNCDNHHPSLMFLVNRVNTCSSQPSFTDNVYDFNNCDFFIINDFLLNVNWDDILKCDIDQAVERFYLVLSHCLGEFVPTKTIKSDFKFPIWFNQDLKTLTIQKKIAHKSYRSQPTEANYGKFCELRALCKNLSKMCFNRYIQGIEQNVFLNSKSFWKFVRSKNDQNKIPNLLIFQDQEISEPGDIANVFAQHFSSVYVNDISTNIFSCNNVSSEYNININSYTFKISDILTKLEHIDLNKGPGPDNIPPIFLKNCSFSLSRPLWILFNRSMSEGIFPSSWKISYVVPIFKSNGSKGDVVNYRPISKISLIPKLMEALIAEYLEKCFNGIIIANQHGFMKKKSITSNLVLYSEYIYDSLEEGHDVDSIYTDFSKGFDKINHRLLIEKLSHYGLAGNLLKWIKSFLENRQQVVKINNKFSNIINVTSGVPQGGHLSPLLFNIFINDVKFSFQHCNFILYADDLKIYKKIINQNCLKELQDDLDRFYNWCVNNKMFLNTEKCKHIRFSRSSNTIPPNYNFGSTSLERVDTIRDLGVLIDSKLTFLPHIENCCSKALQILGFIKRNTNDFKNINAIKLLYVTLVRPILENCSVVWNPQCVTYLDKINRVQKRFLRYIAFKMRIPTTNLDYCLLEKKLNLQNINKRLTNNDIVFCYKIIHNLVDCPGLLDKIQFHVPSRTLRVANTFQVPFHRTSYGQNSPITRMMRSADSFDGDLFNISLLSLKQSLNCEV